MARKVVVCCDGTWNDPDADTNIWRTYVLMKSALPGVPETIEKDGARHVAGLTKEGQSFLVFYDKGVGTARWQRGSGGAFGAGLGDKVRRAYAFLAEHAQPDDELYLTGFSRGAFTVRSLAGMLGCAGLPTKAGAAAVDAAWTYYRTPPKRPPRQDVLAAYAPRDVPIRFLGVYDTVGSLGVPIPQLGWLNGLLDRLLGGVVRFHDTTLGRQVEVACQALAIHERRGTFKPVVWSRAPGKDQKVLQVWFTGSHGNVGGGYDHADLADITLEWMMKRAAEAGLPVDFAELAKWCSGNCYGARYDSDRSWLGRIASGDTFQTVSRLVGILPFGVGAVTRVADVGVNLLAVRPVDRAIGGEIEADDGTSSICVGERVHASVVDRYRGELMPPSVAKALGAHVAVFRERAENREHCVDQKAEVNGYACPVLDLSKSGARIADAAWLRPGEEVTFQRQGHSRYRARVVWQQGSEAGLQSIEKRSGPASVHSAEVEGV